MRLSDIRDGARGERTASIAAMLAGLALLAPLVYLLVLAAEGSQLARPLRLSTDVELLRSRHPVLAPVLIAGIGALACLALLARDRRRIRASQAAADAARRELDAARRRERDTRDDAQAEVEAARAEHAQHTGRLEDELEQVRTRLARTERARQSEKAWNQELRAQLSRMHQERGPLADWSDLRAMVLHMAIELLEAEKGLLLSRAHHDGDGPLDLVCSEGFDHDPTDSAVAQRFAEEVIERDRTVRESDRRRLDAQGDSPADAEIENLVAIPIYIQDRFSGVVICANKEGGFHDHDEDVLLSLGDHAGAVLENSRLHGEARSSFLGTVRMLADAIEIKDPALGGHSEDVSQLVASVADRLGLAPRQRESLIFSSLLHDIGKIGISERILLKPTSLTAEERSIIELHPRLGFGLVQQVPSLAEIAPAVLHHHERFDGSGYPAGLRGTQIPLEARVIAVIDAYSAMTTQRAYNVLRSPQDACQELKRCAGTQFDPEIVTIFCEEVARLASEPQQAPASALEDDPELQARRREQEPVFGYDSFALTDSLTLLYSHRHLHEKARSEAQRAALQGEPFSVALIELTDVAERNRRGGYAAGDMAIKEAARALQHVAARWDAAACRDGGARLAVVATVEETAAADLAREIGEALHGGPPARVAISTWRTNEDGDDVIARARRQLTRQPASTPAL